MNVINFSGHNLSEQAAVQLEQKFDDAVVVETVKISLYRKKPLFSQISNVMQNLTTVLNNGAQPVVILPGLPIAAALILSYIHGVSGRFPKVIELLRNMDNIYEVHDVHDLEFYRQGSRRNR